MPKRGPAHKLAHLRAKYRQRRRAARKLALASEVRDTFAALPDVWNDNDIALWPLGHVHTIVVDPSGKTPGSVSDMKTAMAQVPSNGNGRHIRIEIKAGVLPQGLALSRLQIHNYSMFVVKGVP